MYSCYECTLNQKKFIYRHIKLLEDYLPFRQVNSEEPFGTIESYMTHVTVVAATSKNVTALSQDGAAPYYGNVYSRWVFECLSCNSYISDNM